MRGLARAAAATLVAFAVTSAIAPIASGETNPSGVSRPHVKKARGKKKKRVRHVAPTVTPRTTSRLTLATATSDEAPLVDESQLPPARDGASCPPEMASIDARFCIDKWEGSLVEMRSDGDRVFPFTSTLDGRTVRAVSVPDAFPQGYISGAEAAQACTNAGKRLCSRVEWRKACVGPTNARFGYGDARVRGRCNDHGRSPMLAIWGVTSESPASDWSEDKMNDPRLNELAGSLARTGAHAECTNDYGVYDMVGNLHEWTSDPDGTFQGGYYLDTSINGDGCAYRTTAHDFSYHDYSTGFRCCADPR